MELLSKLLQRIIGDRPADPSRRKFVQAALFPPLMLQRMPKGTAAEQLESLADMIGLPEDWLPEVVERISGEEGSILMRNASKILSDRALEINSADLAATNPNINQQEYFAINPNFRSLKDIFTSSIDKSADAAFRLGLERPTISWNPQLENPSDCVSASNKAIVDGINTVGLPRTITAFKNLLKGDNSTHNDLGTIQDSIYSRLPKELTDYFEPRNKSPDNLYEDAWEVFALDSSFREENKEETVKALKLGAEELTQYIESNFEDGPAGLDDIYAYFIAKNGGELTQAIFDAEAILIKSIARMDFETGLHINHIKYQSNVDQTAKDTLYRDKINWFITHLKDEYTYYGDWKRLYTVYEGNVHHIEGRRSDYGLEPYSDFSPDFSIINQIGMPYHVTSILAGLLYGIPWHIQAGAGISRAAVSSSQGYGKIATNMRAGADLWDISQSLRQYATN